MPLKIKEKLISFIIILPLFYSCVSLSEKQDYKDISHLTPKEAEEYLIKEELQVKDIVPNTQKEINWYHKYEKTEYSLVYLPGYSSTRQEIRPIPEEIAKAMKMNYFGTRFKGNGIKGGADSYKGVTVQDHMRDAYEALMIGSIIGKKVILMGTSTGSTFAIWLANKFPDLVAGLIFISPNHEPSDSLGNFMLGPFGRQLTYGVTREYLRSKSVRLTSNKENKYMGLEYSSEVQHADASIAMMGIVGIARKINPNSFDMPYLVFYSEKDIVISVKKLKEFFDQYGTKTNVTKEAVALKGIKDLWQHAPVGDFIDPSTSRLVISEVVSFLKENLGRDFTNQENQEVIKKEFVFNIEDPNFSSIFCN